jgi:pyrroline-5-carboxylate reductase
LAFQVGQGTAFWQAAPGLSSADKKRVRQLLNVFTWQLEVYSENLIDAGGIIYGSAKAFYFLLANALEHAAIKLGISGKTAHLLVEKTFLGAALLQESQDYGELIKNVATKKGVTEALLKVFADRHFDNMVEQAVRAGLKRTKELSHG